LTHDEDGTFIKKWVPELAHLPISFVHEPYLMTVLDQQFNNFKLGEDYPNPIVEIKFARKKASDILWEMKKDARVQEENYRILKKHTNTDKTKI
jgi:deoxyribodipyrimidine photo-lyase